MNFIIFDWLFITWVFWPIVTILLWGAYDIVITASRNAYAPDELLIWPGILMAIVLAGVLHEFPTLHPYALSAEWWGIGLGAYLLVGFAVAFYKWCIVIMDFHTPEVDTMLKAIRSRVRDLMAHASSESGSQTESEQILSRAKSEFGRRLKLVEVTHDTGVVEFLVYPDWMGYPLASWWVYWPFFILTTVFDPIQRIVRRLLTWLRGVLDGIARSRAVRC